MDEAPPCPTCAHDWSAADANEASEAPVEQTVKDSAGNPLQDGDSITIVRDSKVEGVGMSKRMLSGVVVIAGLVAASTGLAAPAAADPMAGPTRSIILNAFGDVKATYGESKPFLDSMTNRVDRTGESAYCKGVVEGDLSGQPVTVVITGTGSGNAGPCAQEMLGWYSPNIKEFIWSGIGGVTPAVGGMVDKAGRPLGNAPVMIGDRCIGVASWAYDLHFSNVNDWAAARTSPSNAYDPSGGWWQMMNAKGEQVAPGFDNVQQFAVAQTALADEVLRASKTATDPKRPASVTAKISRFHPNRAHWRDPKSFSYRTCGGEVSSDDFWHGATEDRLARGYMAGLMRVSGINPKAKASNIVAFSAMEAVPWMTAVTRWNAKNGTDFPMVVIRAASNYDMIPLQANGQPVRGKNGKPITAMEDIDAGFDNESSAYAAASAAAPVLRMFQLRAAG